MGRNKNMALQGCIGSNDFQVRMIVKKFWLWERLRNDEIDSDEFSAESFILWKERYGHSSPKPTPRCGPHKKASSPNLKWCYTCNQEKARTEFAVDRSRGDGLNTKCRKCAARKWKEQNGIVCEKCNGPSIGHVCNRCYRMRRVIRDADLVIKTIPDLIAQERQRTLDRMSVAQRQTYLQAEKLRDLALRFAS